METLLLMLLLMPLFAGLCAHIARSKHRSATLWAVAGLLTGVVAVGFVLWVPPRPAPPIRVRKGAIVDLTARELVANGGR